jgi:hypothetical protein
MLIISKRKEKSSRKILVNVKMKKRNTYITLEGSIYVQYTARTL